MESLPSPQSASTSAQQNSLGTPSIWVESSNSMRAPRQAISSAERELHASDTITKTVTAKTTLETLPETADFGCPPWGIVSTATLAHALQLDRGVFGTWRLRGLGPTELPQSWFAMGRANAYLVTGVLAWLAARNGLVFDEVASWREHLNEAFGIETVQFEETRLVARLLAEKAGPEAYVGVKFSNRGFASYLSALLQRS